jgi:hypothetical protein
MHITRFLAERFHRLGLTRYDLLRVQSYIRCAEEVAAAGGATELVMCASAMPGTARRLCVWSFANAAKARCLFGLISLPEQSEVRSVNLMHVFA